MRVGRFGFLFAALLLAASVLPGGVVVGEEENGKDDRPHDDPPGRTVQGRVLLPTLVAVRPFTPRTLDGITHYYLPDVQPGAKFTLRADAQPLVAVPCVGICSPDFDILYYGAAAGDGFEHVAGRFNEAGDEAGKVPMTAEFAFVFLRGPNTPPDAFGTRFVYREG